MTKPKRALDRAIDILHGRILFAKAMQVTPPTVDYWRSEKGQVAAEKCPRIEKLTKRAVTCEQLRPDVEWEVLRLQIETE